MSSSLCEDDVSQYEAEQLSLCGPFCHSRTNGISGLRRDNEFEEMWEAPAGRALGRCLGREWTELVQQRQMPSSHPSSSHTREKRRWINSFTPFCDFVESNPGTFLC